MRNEDRRGSAAVLCASPWSMDVAVGFFLYSWVSTLLTRKKAPAPRVCIFDTSRIYLFSKGNRSWALILC